MENNQRYLTLKQTAEYLGMTESALRTMVARRQIPFLKLGERRIRFDKTAIERAFTRFESVDQII